MYKEGDLVNVELVSGAHVSGRLVAFDQEVVVLESEGREILISKHAIVTISAGGGPPADPDPDPGTRPRRGGAARVQEPPPLVIALGKVVND